MYGFGFEIAMVARVGCGALWLGRLRERDGESTVEVPFRAELSE
jgi:hypothetical protein